MAASATPTPALSSLRPGPLRYAERVFRWGAGLGGVAASYRGVVQGMGGELSRRRLLRVGAMGGLAALATACGASRHNSGGTTSSTSSTPASPPLRQPVQARARPRPARRLRCLRRRRQPRSPPPPRPPSQRRPCRPRQLLIGKTLGAGLTGRLSRPGDPGYFIDKELYDPLFDSVRPAGIAFCANASDVARSLAFAREHDLPLTARSGGHSYAGYSTSTGLVMDVSLMSQLAVSGQHRQRRCRCPPDRRLHRPSAAGCLGARRVMPFGRGGGFGARRRYRRGRPAARANVRQHRRSKSCDGRQPDRRGQRHHQLRSVLGLQRWGRGELRSGHGVPTLDVPRRPDFSVRLELALGRGRASVARLAGMVFFPARSNVVQLHFVGRTGAQHALPFCRWVLGGHRGGRHRSGRGPHQTAGRTQQPVLRATRLPRGYVH